MHHYEIAVTPLTEEARAHGGKPFTEQADAYVLGAIRDDGDESATTITKMQGTTIMWGAFIDLVESLERNYPLQTAAALAVALGHARAGNGDKTMH